MVATKQRSIAETEYRIGRRGRRIVAAFRERLHCWRERHWRRAELASLSEHDLRAMGVPRDLAVYEARRWPWQLWNPQWRELDELFGRAAQRSRPAAQPDDGFRHVLTVSLLGLALSLLMAASTAFGEGLAAVLARL
jgi:uncharacterized protein YjiS (DUF1127 family)